MLGAYRLESPLIWSVVRSAMPVQVPKPQLGHGAVFNFLNTNLITIIIQTHTQTLVYTNNPLHSLPRPLARNETEGVHEPEPCRTPLPCFCCAIIWGKRCQTAFSKSTLSGGPFKSLPGDGGGARAGGGDGGGGREVPGSACGAEVPRGYASIASCLLPIIESNQSTFKQKHS